MVPSKQIQNLTTSHRLQCCYPKASYHHLSCLFFQPPNWYSCLCSYSLDSTQQLERLYEDLSQSCHLSAQKLQWFSASPEKTLVTPLRLENALQISCPFSLLLWPHLFTPPAPLILASSLICWHSRHPSRTCALVAPSAWKALPHDSLPSNPSSICSDVRPSGSPSLAPLAKTEAHPTLPFPSLSSSRTHALEKEMATHSSILAWRIPGMEEPGGLPSMGSHRVRHDWWDLAAAAVHMYI